MLLSSSLTARVSSPKLGSPRKTEKGQREMLSEWAEEGSKSRKHSLAVGFNEIAVTPRSSTDRNISTPPWARRASNMLAVKGTATKKSHVAKNIANNLRQSLPFLPREVVSILVRLILLKSPQRRLPEEVEVLATGLPLLIGIEASDFVPGGISDRDNTRPGSATNEGVESMLKDMCKFFRYRTYSLGEPVFHEGEEGSCFYVIMSGEVCLSARRKDSEQQKSGINQWGGHLATKQRQPEGGAYPIIDELDNMNIILTYDYSGIEFLRLRFFSYHHMRKNMIGNWPGSSASLPRARQGRARPRRQSIELSSIHEHQKKDEDSKRRKTYSNDRTNSSDGRILEESNLQRDVLKGVVPSDEVVIKESLRPGASFGEIALMEKVKRTLTVRSSCEETELLFLTKAEFDELLRERFERPIKRVKETLKSTPMFHSFSDHQLTYFAHFFKPITIGRGTGIAKNGPDPNEVATNISCSSVADALGLRPVSVKGKLKKVEMLLITKGSCKVVRRIVEIKRRTKLTQKSLEDTTLNGKGVTQVIDQPFHHPELEADKKSNNMRLTKLKDRLIHAIDKRISGSEELVKPSSPWRHGMQTISLHSMAHIKKAALGADASPLAIHGLDGNPIPKEYREGIVVSELGEGCMIGEEGAVMSACVNSLQSPGAASGVNPAKITFEIEVPDGTPPRLLTVAGHSSSESMLSSPHAGSPLKAKGYIIEESSLVFRCEEEIVTATQVEGLYVASLDIIKHMDLEVIEAMTSAVEYRNNLRNDRMKALLERALAFLVGGSNSNTQGKQQVYNQKVVDKSDDVDSSKIISKEKYQPQSQEFEQEKGATSLELSKKERIANLLHSLKLVIPSIRHLSRVPFLRRARGEFDSHANIGFLSQRDRTWSIEGMEEFIGTTKESPILRPLSLTSTPRIKHVLHKYGDSDPALIHQGDPNSTQYVPYSLAEQLALLKSSPNTPMKKPQGNATSVTFPGDSTCEKMSERSSSKKPPKSSRHSIFEIVQNLTNPIVARVGESSRHETEGTPHRNMKQTVSELDLDVLAAKLDALSYASRSRVCDQEIMEKDSGRKEVGQRTALHTISESQNSRMHEQSVEVSSMRRLRTRTKNSVAKSPVIGPQEKEDNQYESGAATPLPPSGPRKREPSFFAQTKSSSGVYDEEYVANRHEDFQRRQRRLTTSDSYLKLPVGKIETERESDGEKSSNRIESTSEQASNRINASLKGKESVAERKKNVEEKQRGKLKETVVSFDRNLSFKSSFAPSYSAVRNARMERLKERQQAREKKEKMLIQKQIGILAGKPSDQIFQFPPFKVITTHIDGERSQQQLGSENNQLWKKATPPQKRAAEDPKVVKRISHRIVRPMMDDKRPTSAGVRSRVVSTIKEKTGENFVNDRPVNNISKKDILGPREVAQIVNHERKTPTIGHEDTSFGTHIKEIDYISRSGTPKVSVSNSEAMRNTSGRYTASADDAKSAAREAEYHGMRNVYHFDYFAPSTRKDLTANPAVIEAAKAATGTYPVRQNAAEVENPFRQAGNSTEQPTLAKQDEHPTREVVERVFLTLTGNVRHHSLGSRP